MTSRRPIPAHRHPASGPAPLAPGRRSDGESADTKSGMHARNPHRHRYDFAVLIRSTPALGPFVSRNRHGDDSLDFADPRAVKMLNQAILHHVYGISGWDIPEGYLCPPIPGRADYIHHLADLLASSDGGSPPRGSGVRIIDIGVGANCVYPIIGHCAYGWSFIATDIDATALASTRRIVAANRVLHGAIECRLQGSSLRTFVGTLGADERCDASLCNPPFHCSRQAAQQATERKWRNLGLPVKGGGRGGRDGRDGHHPLRNFGGQAGELWCDGGEIAFIQRMVAESAARPLSCLWYTTLVAKAASLPALVRSLARAEVRASRIIDQAHGQKQSRILAWTFLEKPQRHAWARGWRGRTA